MVLPKFRFCPFFLENAHPDLFLFLSVNPTAELDGNAKDENAKIACDGAGGVVAIWSSATTDVTPPAPLPDGLISWLEFVMTSEVGLLFAWGFHWW